jgi:hypothetical protein
MPGASVTQENQVDRENQASGWVARQSDRASRFLARLDTELPIISDQLARRAFLDRQIEGWERRYARFIATDGASEPVANPADPPQAADFLLTIIGLAARRGTERQGVDARLDGPRREHPDSKHETRGDHV